MITLGIETSCDETSVAALDDSTILSNLVYSQMEHARFGGVVPEIASRAHLEKISSLADAVLRDTALSIGNIDLIAVTDSPGLAGALLIGVSFALGLHARWNVPVTGINHLEGHICSIFIHEPLIEPPFLALVASGGHTALYRVNDIGNYTCLGQTVDDAAGEAFDKVGKMLGFSYPAGRAIEEEARRAETTEGITFPVARFQTGSLDFSFSGLKTAVKYFVNEHGPDYTAAHRPAICKAFQEAVVGSLVANVAAAIRSTGIKTVVPAGGVACNSRLREEMKKQFGTSVFFPPPALCADNGAMIACAGFKRSARKLTRPPRMDPGGAL